MRNPTRLLLLTVLALGFAVLSGCRVESGTGTTGLPAAPTAYTASPPTDAAAAGPGSPTNTSSPTSRPLPPTAVPATVAIPAPEVRRIAPDEVKTLFDAGDAVIVDARAVASYQQLHIVGALSMPLSTVATRYTELPTDKLIVFYCT